MKKVFAYLGWILFALSLIAIFWIARPEDTVDFSGIVKAIEYNEHENCTYFTAYMIHDEDLSVIIKAEDSISVKEITGEKMTINAIQVGDLLNLDYTGKIDGKDSIVTAKWIKVAKGYMTSKSEVN